MAAWHRVAAISTHHNGVVCRLFVGQTEPGSLYFFTKWFAFCIFFRGFCLVGWLEGFLFVSHLYFMRETVKCLIIISVAFHN